MAVCKALTIAGSDSGGGAGIQADLKTFQELGVYGMSAVTAVTAQNTYGVHGVYPLPTEAVVGQMTAVGDDLPPDAVKTGMLFTGEIIAAVAEQAARYHWTNMVVDPVMVSKSGVKLLQDDAVFAMKQVLVPRAKVFTPNIPEAEVLTGMTIRDLADRKEAAAELLRLGAEVVVIKGGHAECSSVLIDLIYDGQQFTELSGRRFFTKNTHGTGCTFSAAIAAFLAKGCDVIEAIRRAQMFVQASVEDDLQLGGGYGPTNHWAYRRKGVVL